MKVQKMKSSKYNNVQRLDSNLITYYEYEDNEHHRATIFIDRMKVEKMDLEGGVIDIKLKVAKGKGYNNS